MTLETDDLLEVLPHRPPMLMLDRVVELEPGVRAVGIKQVTEQSCAGHFPGHPVMPGVHVAEAMAQVAAVIFLAGAEEHRGRPVYLVGLDKIRFRRPVVPGDELRIAVEVERQRKSLVTFTAEATVGGARVASGSLLATAPEASQH